MSGNTKGLLFIVCTTILLTAVAIIILNIANFFVTHSFISGLVIGLVVGAGVAYASILIFRWFETHKIIEIKDKAELEDGLEIEDDTK